MNMKIVSEKENPLLKRREVVAEISHPGASTPPRKEMLAGLSKSLKTKESLIVVDKIFTRKGSPSCEARVLVYKKEEDIPKEKLEKQKRRSEKKKKPLAEEKPPEKKEKKGEEKPEEKKENAKDTPEKAQEKEMKKE